HHEINEGAIIAARWPTPARLIQTGQLADDALAFEPVNPLRVGLCVGQLDQAPELVLTAGFGDVGPYVLQRPCLDVRPGCPCDQLPRLVEGLGDLLPAGDLLSPGLAAAAVPPPLRLW